MFAERLAYFTDKPADEYVLLEDHAEDDIGLMSDGSVMVVVKLDGRPMSLLDEETRYAARRSRHSTLGALFDTNISVYEHHVCHDRVQPFEPGEFRSRYGRQCIEDYHRSLDDRVFARDWYISIVVHPRALNGMADPLGWLRLKKPEVRDSLVRQAREKASAIMSGLRDYRPRRQGTRWQGGVPYSEIGEALRLFLYGGWHPVPRTRGHMAGAVYTDRVICGMRGFEVRRGLGSGRASAWGVMLGFRDYPEVTKPWILDCLQNTTCRMVMTNRFRFRSASAATSTLSLTQSRMKNARDRSVTLREGLDKAMDDIESGRTVSGDHHWSLALHADTRDELEQALSDIKSSIAEKSNIAMTTEAVGTFAAYWGQIPGASAVTLARHGLISGKNFCSFSSLNGYPSGSPAPHWRPLFRLITSGHTTHDFDPHVRRVGHTLLIGPTGFGKSTFIGFTAIAADQALSATGGLVVILDKDASNELAVLASGGRYIRIRVGDTKTAPIKRLIDTKTSKWWFTQFLIGLILDDKGPMPPPDQLDRLRRAVDFLARRPKELRWIGGVRQFLDHGPSSTGGRLERWCRGGDLGWVFDNAEDEIDLDAGIVGIDNTEILPAEMERIRMPMAAYQFYRIRERVGRGVRGAVIVDEMASYLPDARFSAGFDAFSRELRKGNGMLWMAVHHPQDLEHSSVGQTLLANTPTKILYPNPYADEDAYRRLLKCSTGEIEAIVEGMAKLGDGTFMVRRSEGSFVARLPLDRLPEHIAILSSDPRRSDLWHSIAAKHGGDPDKTWAVYRSRYREAEH